jgi:surface antigen
MKAEITPQHTWLHQLVGEWRFESEADFGPDQPAMKSEGSERVRQLGDNWVLCEGSGDMGGGPALTQMTLGYDPAKGHFVGTFIGSMMNHLWIYHRGALDAGQKSLALDAEGPAFDGPPGTMAQFRDVIEVVSRDERLLHAHVQGPDGQWTRFMTTRYTRIG